MKTIEKFANAIEKRLGFPGRMISGSKSRFREMFPKHAPIFNSNLVIDNKKVWHGDIDLTLDTGALKEISESLNKKIYVLYEMDGRFENEEKPLIHKFVLSVEGETVILGKGSSEWYEIVDNKSIYKKI